LRSGTGNPHAGPPGGQCRPDGPDSRAEPPATFPQPPVVVDFDGGPPREGRGQASVVSQFKLLRGLLAFCSGFPEPEARGGGGKPGGGRRARVGQQSQTRRLEGHRGRIARARRRGDSDHRSRRTKGGLSWKGTRRPLTGGLGQTAGTRAEWRGRREGGFTAVVVFSKAEIGDTGPENGCMRGQGVLV